MLIHIISAYFKFRTLIFISDKAILSAYLYKVKQNIYLTDI